MVEKDKNDNALAFCTVCLKYFSVAAHGKKASVLNVSHKFHKSKLPTSSQTTVKFVKDKPEGKENISENENATSTSRFSSSSSSINGVSYGQGCDRCRNSLGAWCHFQQLLPKLLAK